MESAVGNEEINEEEDDDVTLSSNTLMALQEFYKEQEEKEKLLNNLNSESDIVSFDENWQLSQFWYDDETIKVLSEEALNAAGTNSYIALISCPSLYLKIKNSPIMENGKVVLFEFDKRFSVYGSDFVHYDYNNPTDVPQHFEKSFDIVVADPPFLSDECLEKTAQTVRFLAKDKIILCTGSVMKSRAEQVLNVKNTKFEPHHKNNLANTFCCFSNYEFVNKIS